MADPPARPPPRNREEAIALFKDAEEMKKLRRRLVLFARSRQPKSVRSLADAEEVAQNAIGDTLAGLLGDGGRQWDPVKYPDPFLYLAGVIRSLVANETSSLRFQKEKLRPRRFEDESTAPDAPDSGADVHEIARERGKAGRADERLGKVRARLLAKGDALGLRVLDALQSGKIDPAAIADEMSVPVAKVYEARRRMKAHLDAVLAEDPDSSGPMKAAAVSHGDDDAGPDSGGES